MTLLRILKVTQVYPPFSQASGQALTVQAVARHLSRRGHRVTVLTASQGRYTRSPRNNVETVYLPAMVHLRAIALSPGILSFCLRRLGEFDIAHIYGLYDAFGPVVAAFCRRLRIPYVLEPIGMFRPIVRNIRLKRVYQKLVGWRMAMNAARIIATSCIERDELVAEGVPASRVTIRRNGIDLSEFDSLPQRGSFRTELGLTDGAPLVLYLGRISHKKGLDLLVEAFSHTPRRATLAIVGPDDGDGCIKHIRRLSARFGVTNRVRVMGPRYGTQKLSAFVDADVFVLPSRSENFGNAAGEAVACGVPTIVTDRCGVAEVLKNRAALVVPCEAESLRDALNGLLLDTSLSARLRAGAVQLRQTLSWDEPVNELEHLYHALLRNQSNMNSGLVSTAADFGPLL